MGIAAESFGRVLHDRPRRVAEISFDTLTENTVFLREEWIWSSALGIQKVGQISITVHDLPRAVAFYRDILELPFVWQTDGMAFFNCGDLRLLLSVPERPEYNYPSSIVYYNVADIHKAYDLLTARGVRFKGAPHEIGKLGDITVWMAFFTDSEGNTVALQSEVPNQ